MKKFEAGTLEEAYAAAAKEFSCSVTELDIQIVQNPSRGFLGFGRKNAVIVAMCKEKSARPKPEKQGIARAHKEKKAAQKESAVITKEARRPKASPQKSEEREKEPAKQELPAAPAKEQPNLLKRRDKDIFDNFYDETPDMHVVVSEVEKHINNLFSSACFRIEPVRVFALDDETVQIEFKGEDAALLIGKEGYRYKAMAYLLYNWIHGKYGYKIRLEIAEFLQNQEAMMESYLQPIIERIENEGRAQTKILDGILVQIALQKLRERYPQKYVAVRTNKEGGRYVIVNEFMERR